MSIDIMGAKAEAPATRAAKAAVRLFSVEYDLVETRHFQNSRISFPPFLFFWGKGVGTLCRSPTHKRFARTPACRLAGVQRHGMLRVALVAATAVSVAAFHSSAQVRASL